jgi:hypothetical protein
MGGGPERTFPAWITLLSTLVAMLLFLTMTVPAVREQRELRRIESEKARLRAQYEDTLRTDRERRRALHWDPQTVLLEIDRLGLTPQELLEIDAQRLAAEGRPPLPPRAGETGGRGASAR